MQIKNLPNKNNKYPFVSVIIPTYNRKENLELAIKALLMQNYPINKYEIIIADDGSDDGTKKLINSFIKKFPDRLKYCFQEHRRFRAGQARNMGAKYSKGDILLFLDSDIIAFPNLIANHIHSLKTVDCVLGYASGHLSTKKHNFNTIKNILERNISQLDRIKIIPEQRHLSFNDYRINTSKKNKGIWKNFISVNFSIKKYIFDRLKFNEQFVGWGMEDLEFGYRFLKMRYNIKMDANCIGLHMPHKGGYSYFIPKEKISSYIKNTILFYTLYPNANIKKWISADVLRIIKDKNEEEYLLSEVRKITKKNRLRLLYQSFFQEMKSIPSYIDKIIGKIGIFIRRTFKK